MDDFLDRSDELHVEWTAPCTIDISSLCTHNETYEGITNLSQGEESAGGSVAARPFEAGEHYSIPGD